MSKDEWGNERETLSNWAGALWTFAIWIAFAIIMSLLGSWAGFFDS